MPSMMVLKGGEDHDDYDLGDDDCRDRNNEDDDDDDNDDDESLKDRDKEYFKRRLLW